MKKTNPSSLLKNQQSAQKASDARRGLEGTWKRTGRYVDKCPRHATTQMRLFQKTAGSTFLITMVCVFVMSLVGGYSYQLSSYNSTYVNRLQKSLQAHQLAEAGLVRALSTIRSNWSQVNNAAAFPLTTFGTGTYDAGVTNISGRYLVSSVGTVSGVSRTVTAEVAAPAFNALNYIFAGGSNGSHEIEIGGSSSSGTITGDIYGAGNFELEGPSGGGQLTVTGNVYALSNITTNASVSVSGSQNPNYSNTVQFPVVDFSYYQNIATTNGQYYASNVTYNSGGIPASPAGGVIFVNGNIDIRGTQNTTACIIATGNITIAKSGNTYPRVTINQYSNYPALMTQNGEITFSSTGTGNASLVTTGLVYAGNNLRIDGNHDTFSFTGSVISRGKIEIDSSSQSTMTATYVQQSPPGFTTSSSGTMAIRSYTR